MDQHFSTWGTKYEKLWLTTNETTRDWVYRLDSFAIYSLRFFLHSALVAHFVVEILKTHVGTAASAVPAWAKSVGTGTG